MVSTFKFKPMNYNWMTLSFPFLMSLKRAIKDIDQCRQVNKYLEKKLANNTAMIEMCQISLSVERTQIFAVPHKSSLRN